MEPLRAALDDLPRAAFADLLESDEAYLLVLDVPGVSEGDLDVRVVDDRLHVEGRRAKDVPDGYEYRTEERSLFVDLDLPLPADAVDETATATVTRGVLQVELPKRSTAGREIPIDA